MTLRLCVLAPPLSLLFTPPVLGLPIFPQKFMSPPVIPFFGSTAPPFFPP